MAVESEGEIVAGGDAPVCQDEVFGDFQRFVFGTFELFRLGRVARSTRVRGYTNFWHYVVGVGFREAPRNVGVVPAVHREHLHRVAPFLVHPEREAQIPVHLVRLQGERTVQAVAVRLPEVFEGYFLIASARFGLPAFAHVLQIQTEVVAAVLEANTAGFIHQEASKSLFLPENRLHRAVGVLEEVNPNTVVDRSLEAQFRGEDG